MLTTDGRPFVEGTEAARQGVSTSRYLAHVLAERRHQVGGYRAAHVAFMTRGSRPLRSPGDTLPAHENLHERLGTEH